MRLLESLAKAFALFAGAILVLVTLATCYSIIGRDWFGKPLLGDIELVQIAMAFGVAAFLPYCQFKRGNINVDFFTSRASRQTRNRMDRFGSLLLAVMCGLLAWRTGLAALSESESGSTTALLEFPEWIAIAAMVPSLALTSVIALAQTLAPPPAASED